ncbi:leucine-rich repeat domain-containing protein [Ruminococcus sp.]|uniref:leucine-rich repeat domain-containing protein n=1 Tax=Ruminococcus sp. TaxID=41978 RepID=UPI0025D21B45|nr:leucine-rich repeat domain-containing protein [Ruminococcus sp.]MCR4639484.1 leucine-rich repeat domain-containing protein [Ruminococcus sp.]
MKNRLLAIAMSAAVFSECFASMPDVFSAQAISSWGLEGDYVEYRDGADGELGLTYYIYSDHAVLTNVDWDLSGVTIPDTVKGVPVTSITDEAFMGEQTTNISIPSTVTDIGSSLGYLDTEFTVVFDVENQSFKDVDGIIYNSDMTELIRCIPTADLKEVTIPDTVKKIDEKAFNNCEKIKNVNLPASVQDIGDDAFNNCSSLESIDVNGDNKEYCSIDGVLFDKNMEILYQYPIGSSESSYTIPDNVSLINSGAFLNSDNLESVRFNKEVQTIGSYAFFNCDKLNNVVLPDSVAEIGYYAFAQCESLKDIVFSENIIKADGDIITDSPWFDEQPDGIVYIGKVLYKVKGRLPENSDVTVKEGTVSICNSAFCTEDGEYGKNTEGDKKLISVKLPESIRYINREAFKGCINLKEINLPDSISEIGISAFEGCSALKEVHIPTSLVSVDYSAFALCSSLEEVVLPENVETVNSSAFAD